MHMTRHWHKVLGLTAASSFIAITGTALASDIDIDDASSSCHVAGNMAVHDDKTSWSLVVSDLTGEGNDCYARIVIHRSTRADSEVRSFQTHGQDDGVAFDGTRLRTETTGATLYACVDRGADGDDCTEVDHVEEN
jgi:hypothetical protein